MRKRKLFIGALLAFAIAFLGIGYAAVAARQLTISGTATAESNATLDVNFTSGSKTAGSEGATGTVTVANNKSQTATITVGGLDTKDEYVTLTLNVANESTEFDAALDTTFGEGETATKSGYTVTNSNSTYFSVAVTPAASVAHSGTAECVVTITLLKTPVDQQTATITITIQYTAQALS